MGREAHWMDVPNHLLSLIADKLINVAEYVSFGAVCSSWQSAYTEKPIKLPPVLLILPPNTDEEQRSLYDLAENAFYHNFQVSLPRNAVCHGSSHGWLVLVLNNSKIILFNPLLSQNNEIKLPSLPPTNSPGYPHGCNLSPLSKAIVYANPLSHDGFVVVAIHDAIFRKDLSIFKSGDEAWTHVMRKADRIANVIHYNDKIYVIHDNTRLSFIDVSGPSPIVSTTSRELLPHDYHNFKSYLVESSGELLLIIKRILNFYFEMRDKAVVFEAFKLEPISNRWIRVRSLGEHTVFAFHNSALCLSTSVMHGCRPNCIYFVDMDKEDFDMRIEVRHVIGIFSLDDGGIKQLSSFKFKNFEPILLHPDYRFKPLRMETGIFD
ncbi:hypothetical protein ACHQM5_003442 [Ranunculus cassubicifolius]